MPMSIFVGKIFWICSDLSSTFFTCICKSIFITFNTIRSIIFENITRTGQTPITIRTSELFMRSIRRLMIMCITNSSCVVHRTSILVITTVVSDLWNSIKECSYVQKVNVTVCFSREGILRPFGEGVCVRFFFQESVWLRMAEDKK